MRTLAAIVMTTAAAASARAEDVLKIALIMAYTGQFADGAAQMDHGISLYMKQHGDTIAGKKIELIRNESTITSTSSPASPSRRRSCRLPTSSAKRRNSPS